MTVPLICFMSDYGYGDEFAGVCHGVIARRCPLARVIDITHGVRRHDLIAGSLALRAAVRYMPAGAVHLAVVDPGVGSQRRAIAIACPGAVTLVGPDNGLLIGAAEELGGALEAVEISSSPERLEPVSSTFHGRDIFAPVAAARADGVALQDLGEPLEPDGLVALAFPQARVEGTRLHAHALSIDGYGNVALDGGLADAQRARLETGSRLTLTVEGERHAVRYARTFADAAPGELLVFLDATGRLAIAVNGGSAAARLAVIAGAPLSLEAP